MGTTFSRRRNVDNHKEPSRSHSEGRGSVSSGKTLIDNRKPQLNLSDAQIHLLRRTWTSDLQFFYEISSGVYGHIFDQNPSVKLLFPSFATAGFNWRDSEAFRTQTLRFTQVLDDVIKYVDRPTKVYRILEEAGEKHAKYVGRGFKPEMLETFEEAIQVCMREYIERHRLMVDKTDLNSTIEAWDKLAQYTIACMERGCRAQLIKNRH